MVFRRPGNADRSGSAPESDLGDARGALRHLSGSGAPGAGVLRCDLPPPSPVPQLRPSHLALAAPGGEPPLPRLRLPLWQTVSLNSENRLESLDFACLIRLDQTVRIAVIRRAK